MLLKPFLGCLLLALSLPSFAFGEWEFSGFASIGGGKLNQENLRYIDYTDDWSFDSDSVLGLQAQVEISDHWSLISQVVANGYDFTDDDAYIPKIEWFVLGYQINPETQLRLGRFRTPQYMYSTSLEVGYTYQWVRPSQNAYPLFLSPFKHIDGIDINHNMSVEDIDIGIQVFLGQTEGEYEGTRANADYSFGGNIHAAWSNFSARISLQQLNLSIDYPGFNELVTNYDALAAAYAGNAEAVQALQTIPNSFNSEDQQVNYQSLGLSWELDRWTLATEILNFRSADRNFANDADGYYISAAYQFKDVSPYIMIGEYHNRFSDDVKNKVLASEAVAGLASGVNNDLDDLRAGTIATFDLFNVDQETITVGLRYDFHPQADFKFEVEYFNFLSNSYGNFYPDETFDTKGKGGNAVLTSFVIDVVF